MTRPHPMNRKEHDTLKAAIGTGPGKVESRRDFTHYHFDRPNSPCIFDWEYFSTMNDLQQLRQRIDGLLTDDSFFAAAADWPLLELVPQQQQSDWDWLPGLLASLPNADWLPQVVSTIDVTALKAGVLLMHDFVEESHRDSQSIEGRGEHQLGDYWHAILHRREPDYVNAKYWFRQIGSQQAFSELARHAAARLDACPSSRSLDWRNRLGCPQQWKPLSFVDLCESCQSANDPDLMQAAREIQRAEMLLLFRQTYRQATGA